MSLRVLPAMLLLLVAAPAPASEGIRFVANPALRGATIDVAEIRLAYLGEPVRVGDTPLVPVLYHRESVEEEFARGYLRRTASQYTTYWRQRIFSGKGSPPRSFRRIDDLLAFVRRTPGAIAVVDADSPCDGVVTLRPED